MEFFKTCPITPSITRITDITQAHMYLVEGSEKALLIDTGAGVGNIRAFVSTLTDKPLTVVLTHAHCDHAGGAGNFECIYLNRRDYDLIYAHANMENRMMYTELMAKDVYPQLTPEDYTPGFQGTFWELRGGTQFDLGGITAEAVEIPGHTEGMTGFLFCEERILLTGDACNSFVFMFDVETASVEEYREKLLDLREYEPRFDKLLLTHGDAIFVDKALIQDCIAVCDKIMAGTDAAIPFYFLGRTGYIAMESGESNNRLDGGLGNIVYNKEKILRA